MTTPTTAEQIEDIRQEFTREYSDYYGETHEELDEKQIIQCVFDLRATIARLEGELDVAKTAHKIVCGALAESAEQYKELRTRADVAERRVEALVELVQSVRDDAQTTIDLYNKNGPQWTSRESGAEYYDASYVIVNAEERIAKIDAALDVLRSDAAEQNATKIHNQQETKYTSPFPEYGDHMTVEDFKKYVEIGEFIDYDGYGHPTKDGKVDESTCVVPSEVDQIPPDATGILWFNR